MTPPLPGDVVLWRAIRYDGDVVWRCMEPSPAQMVALSGVTKYRARPVAADDAVLAVVTDAKALLKECRDLLDARTWNQGGLVARIDAFLSRGGR